MDGRRNEALVRVARDALAELAPEELAVFDAAAEAYLAAPRRVRRRLRKGDPLGFGVEVSVLSSPVARRPSRSP